MRRGASLPYALGIAAAPGGTFVAAWPEEQFPDVTAVVQQINLGK